MRLLLNFSLLVVSTKSWPLPVSAPGNVFVFAFLMLGLNCCGSRKKSISTCPLEHARLLFWTVCVGATCLPGRFCAFWRIQESKTSVVGLSVALSTYCPGPVLVCVWSNLGGPVALDKGCVFLGDLDYNML
ncbi:hypothetical protein DPMN_118318 [Dreissena polymorpha]|uniref:Secreted protein n=1 Tax=Dreissena polymorpha TaxID=45954 RepID=A0A9D4GKJ1_DREPO|nr:hypothetical protein DPMN_118318 [Dreissena polymorpha]